MLSQSDISEMTDVYTTAAPNDPPAVWMIHRSQLFSQQTPMSMTTLLTSLREKYGKETLTTTAGNDGLYLFWIFFAGLIYYLHRESKREGYPMEHDNGSRKIVQGWPAVPTAKIFRLRDGTTRSTA